MEAVVILQISNRHRLTMTRLHQCAQSLRNGSSPEKVSDSTQKAEPEDVKVMLLAAGVLQYSPVACEGLLLDLVGSSFRNVAAVFLNWACTP